MRLQVSVLDNGFTVVTDHVPNFPLTAASIVCRTGGYHDPRDKLGLAHYFDHMLGHSHPDYTQADYFQMVDRLAINANLSTTSNYVLAHAYGREKSVLEFMNFVAPAFASSAYGVEELEHERGRIIAEVVERELRHDIKKSRVRLKSLFGENSIPAYGFAGKPEHLERISRDDIESFRERHVVGANMMFVSAGGVSHEDAVAFCRAHFGGLSEGLCSQPIIVPLKMVDVQYPLPSHHNKVAGIMFRFDANRVYVRSQDTAQLDLVSLYLNSVMSEELRVNGDEANGARVEFSNICGEGSGLLSIDTSCAPKDYDRLILRMGEILNAVASGDERYRRLFRLAHEQVDNVFGEAAAFLTLDMAARRQRITDCVLSGLNEVPDVDNERRTIAKTSFSDAARIVRETCFERPVLTTEHYGHVGPEQFSGAQISQIWQRQLPRFRAVA